MINTEVLLAAPLLIYVLYVLHFFIYFVAWYALDTKFKSPLAEFAWRLCFVKRHNHEVVVPIWVSVDNEMSESEGFFVVSALMAAPVIYWGLARIAHAIWEVSPESICMVAIAFGLLTVSRLITLKIKKMVKSLEEHTSDKKAHK